MKLWLILGLTIAALLLASHPSSFSSGVGERTPNPSINAKAEFDHIVLIVMENKSTSEVIDNPDTPYINSLIRSYTLLTNYYAVSHPSLPNYLALLGGDTFGIQSDCTSCFVSAPNLVDSLEKKGLSWKAYMESMPTPCFVGSTSLYAQKHDPFIYFDDIRNNPLRCNNIVPLSELSRDITTNAPNFIWITPSLCSDTHDCPMSQGDSFLSKEVPQLLSSPMFVNQRSVLFITWDEDGSNNRVPLLIISPKERIDAGDGRYNHYSLLHTIESGFGLPPLTKNDQQATQL